MTGLPNRRPVRSGIPIPGPGRYLPIAQVIPPGLFAIGMPILRADKAAANLDFFMRSYPRFANRQEKGEPIGQTSDKRRGRAEVPPVVCKMQTHRRLLQNAMGKF